MNIINPPRFADIFKMLAPPTTMVQVYIITVDGQKMVCIGPVAHVPRNGTYTIEDIEFGETLRASDAVKLLDGTYVTGDEVQ